ncbi:chorismate mutase protein [Aspergillus udagawae]|uniref:Chorismate mutase protein n=1 Tax=Aspergillus udagawae TaxID=91492 RepID=A0ABQ1BE14_9EURO|nr:chorismate mutase protein [Aspergillus udagawae]
MALPFAADHQPTTTISLEGFGSIPAAKDYNGVEVPYGGFDSRWSQRLEELSERNAQAIDSVHGNKHYHQHRHEDQIFPEYLDGFPKYSHFLARDEDHATTIFKRFDSVAIRNLLHLERRLAALQALQEKFDEDDRRNELDRPPEVKHPSICWESFEILGTRGKTPWLREWIKGEARHVQDILYSGDNVILDDMERRWYLAHETKSLLREYYEALILYSKVLRLHGPAKRSLNGVKDWFERAGTGEYRQFVGAGAHIYDDEGDILSLRPPVEEDLLSWFVFTFFGRFLLSRKRVPTADPSIIYVDQNKVKVVTTTIGFILALGFLIAAVWAIGKISGMNGRLGALTGFVLGFGLWITFGTSAKRLEIFAATSAYAAVLAVYVTLGDSHCTTPPAPPG